MLNNNNHVLKKSHVLTVLKTNNHDLKTNNHENRNNVNTVLKTNNHENRNNVDQDLDTPPPLPIPWKMHAELSADSNVLMAIMYGR